MPKLLDIINAPDDLKILFIYNISVQKKENFDKTWKEIDYLSY